MRRFLLLLGTVLVLAEAGCGGSRSAEVKGLVTLDGEPLTTGEVHFFPVAGDGQTAAANIGTDGRYHIAKASPVKMKVVIHSSKVVSTRPRYEGVPDSPVDEVRAEVLPPRYSDMKKTELTADLVVGKNTVDLKLKSGKK
jgi:hypothetical protein